MFRVHADDTFADGDKGGGALRIGGAAVDVIVDAAIDLEDEPQLRAVEVDDVTNDHVLPTKLQALTTAVTKQLPHACF